MRLSARTRDTNPFRPRGGSSRSAEATSLTAIPVAAASRGGCSDFEAPTNPRSAFAPPEGHALAGIQQRRPPRTMLPEKVGGRLDVLQHTPTRRVGQGMPRPIATLQAPPPQQSEDAKAHHHQAALVPDERVKPRHRRPRHDPHRTVGGAARGNPPRQLRVIVLANSLVVEDTGAAQDGHEPLTRLPL